MTNMPDVEFVPVFVYGTLRPGLYNHNMALPAMVAEPRPAVVHGFELYANRSDSYPYLVVGSGDVKGEVLLLAPGQHLARIIGMEEGAGYDTRAIKADVTAEDGTVQTIDVVAFILPESRKHYLGTKVEDGDWVPYAAQAESIFNARFRRRG